MMNTIVNDMASVNINAHLMNSSNTNTTTTTTTAASSTSTSSSSSSSSSTFPHQHPPKGSDSRISCWTKVSESAVSAHQHLEHPSHLVFYAWAQYGRHIYMHGGLDFGKHEIGPTSDLSNVMHCLHIETRCWSIAPIRNTMSKHSPGPRSSHTMFVYQKALYVWGGITGIGRMSRASDTKLYRLDLDREGTNTNRNTHTKTSTSTYSWEVVKTKKAPPQARDGHAGVLYQGMYYITGGELSNDSGNSDELWRLNMSTLKWSPLPRGPIERKAHNMWAANGYLYVLGGQFTDRNIQNTITANYTIDDFHSYHIATMTWSTVKMKGVDKPFNISEYTVLPIYHHDDYDGDENENNTGEKSEPTSILIFGGYTDPNKVNGMPQSEELKNMYGDEEWSDFLQPYRNRLLRFDIATQAWTLLQSLHAILPLAQSFAAEIHTDTEKGITEILIGKGYGTTTESIQTKENNFENDPNMCPLVKSIAKSYVKETQYDPSQMLMPHYSEALHVVTIMEDRMVKQIQKHSNNPTTTKTTATVGKEASSWAWTFFQMSDAQIPTCQFLFTPWSPTLHHIVDLSFEDFMRHDSSSVRVVQANDELNMLGVRVQLHGLKGSSHLNGHIGRCGYWLGNNDTTTTTTNNNNKQQQQRYEIILPSSSKSISVKPSNLLLAKPCEVSDVAKLHGSAFAGVGRDPSSPNIYMMMVIGVNALKKQSLMEYFIGNDFVNPCLTDQGCNTVMDTYRGPISRRCQIVVQKAGKQPPASPSGNSSTSGNTNVSKSSLVLTLIATSVGKEISDNEYKFRDFCLEMRKQDLQRCKKFEDDIYDTLQEQRDTSVNVVGPWLKLVVTLDGMVPEVRREIIVSPDITMQNLYQQVLCYTIGWTSNYHCYAFRRIQNTDNGVSESKVRDESIKMMSQECWIGPKKSTALDNMFQFFYIGGAMANDKLITIGQLFSFQNNANTSMHLQFIHDFGDWWSHTIRVSKFEGRVPNNASPVAHLLSGHGAAPPEDIGGIKQYICTMHKLTGKIKVSETDDDDTENGNTIVADPGTKQWWSILNGEIRAKLNVTTLFGSPLEFDLEIARSKLDAAIHQKTQKVGKEESKLMKSCLQSGIRAQVSRSNVTDQPRDPKKFCAICGVTVALKYCNGCNSIAFCCREHQLQSWPTHKKECKRIQRAATKKAKK